MAKTGTSAAAKNAGTGSKKKYNSYKPKNPGKPKPDVSFGGTASAFRSNKFNPWVCVIAFVVPFLLTLIAYYNFYIYPLGDGKRSVLTLDLNGQYIYYFEGIRNAFRGNGSIFYNWSRNLSGGFFGIIGYYLASPFTAIPVLMPRSHILEAIMIMQMCKVGACGTTFCIYAQKSKKLAPGPSIIFATMYSMMAFVVIQLINPMWIDGPIFLPLIMLGVEYLIDDGRKLNLIIPTALLFIANFYIGYMVGIFTVIYFVYYLFFGTERKFKGIKEYGLTIGNAAIAGIVTVMCSLIMILPVYNALALGKFDFSEPDYNWHKHLFKLPELIPTLLPNQYYSVNVDEGTGFYGRPEIYCGVLTVVLAPLYFFNKDIKWNRKIGNAFLILTMVMSMYVKPLNMYWHGGQDPNWLPYRYSFLLSFVLVAMAAEVFAHLDGLRLDPKNFLNEFGKHTAAVLYGFCTFAAISILVLWFEALMKKYNYNESKYKYVAKGIYYKAEMNYGSDRWTEVWFGTLGFGILLAGIYTVLVFTYSSIKKKKTQNILLLAMAGIVFFEGSANCYDSFKKIYKEVGNSCYDSYAEITSAPDDIVAKLYDYDDGFYRAEKTYNRMVNDDMAYGLRGVSHSSSVMNARAIKILEYMGYFTQSFESKYEGSNPVADSLLGIKYVIDDPDRHNANVKLLDASYKKVLDASYQRYDEPNLRVATSYVDIYNNPNALSIGWMADKSVLDIQKLDEVNPFDNLNRLLGSMTGNDGKEYYKSLPSEVLFDETKVYLHDYKHTTGVIHDCYEAYKDAGDAVINVRFTSPVDGNIYMHLSSQVKKSCNVWVGTKKENGEYEGSSSSFYDGYGKYFDTNSSPIVRLGPFTKGTEVEVRFTIIATGDSGKYLGQNEYIMVRKGDGFHFCYLDEDEFAKDITTLREGQWNIDTDKSNERHLEGTVVSKPGQVFVTSIPYEPGWTIKVDGKKVKDLTKATKNGRDVSLLTNKDGSGEIAVVNSFIGINMDEFGEGEHTISMTYTPPGFKTGVVTLILGVLAMIGIYIYDRRRNPVLKERYSKKSGEKAPEEAEPEKAPAKKKVQIIKSKGDVAGDVEAKAKEAAEKEAAEAEEIRKKTEELIDSGKSFTENLSEEAEKAADKKEEMIEEVAEAVEKKAEKAADKTAGAVKNSSNKKSSGKNKKKKK